jgi:RecA/RadA recombinase
MPVAYKCRGCGIVKPLKWTFRCPGCGTFHDIRQVNEDIPGAQPSEVQDGEVVSLQDAIDQVVEIPRIETGLLGMDYVLGNRHQVGFAKNGLYLLTGDPGSGKTTLLIQTLQAAARLRYDALYITGEQTVGDLALRARSFGKIPARFVAVRETDLDVILDIIDERQPAIVVVDSAQTIFVDDELEVGGAASIKVAIRELMKAAKETNTTIIVIGHVTKGGAIGGPKALEHYVDCSFHLSGTKTSSVRTLRCDSKNRFGDTPRQARFAMADAGLVAIDKFELKDGQLVKIDPSDEDDEDEGAQEEKLTKKSKKSKKSFSNDAPTSAVKQPPTSKKPRPKLVSVPLDASPVDEAPSPSLPKSVLPPFWTAEDGTKAEVILAVKCDEPECKGKVDRACTAENGAREAGFHTSRIRKGKLYAAGRDATPTEKRKTKAELDAEAPGPPDPFAPKPLGAKPRVTTKSAKTSHDAPLKTPPRVTKRKPPPEKRPE